MKIPNWFVITGVPSSGKTTVLQILEKKGFQTVDEAARIYIDRAMAAGRTVTEIRNNELRFQKRVLEMKVYIEKKISREKITFFDRGIPDSLAYYVLCGVYYDKMLAKSIKEAVYKKIFLFDPLVFKKDYARTESADGVKKLHNLLLQCYSRLNVPVLKVPVMTAEERADFILSQLG